VEKSDMQIERFGIGNIQIENYDQENLSPSVINVQNCDSRRCAKLNAITTYDRALDAGTRNHRLCTLILTEGESSKQFVDVGRDLMGRDKYGVFCIHAPSQTAQCSCQIPQSGQEK
jgi:hypothetical protein